MSAALQLSLDDVCASRHGGNAESVAAHESIRETKEATRARIYSLALQRGELGVTADEVAALWGCSPNHVAPRITEMKALGLLLPSSVRRPTRAGCSARVLVAKI